MFPFSPIPRAASFHPPFSFPTCQAASVSRYKSKLRYKQTVTVSLNNGVSCRKNLHPLGFQTTWVTGQLHRLGRSGTLPTPRTLLGAGGKKQLPQAPAAAHLKSSCHACLKKATPKTLMYSDTVMNPRTGPQRSATFRRLQSTKKQRRRIVSQLFPHRRPFRAGHRQRRTRSGTGREQPRSPFCRRRGRAGGARSAPVDASGVKH